MIKSIVTVSVVASFLLQGCTSSTINSPALLESQKAYESIRKDTRINQYAAPSLFQAGKLYNLSKTAKSDAEASHYAYLLKQEIEVAKESARGKELSEQIEGLRDKKTKALLDAKEDQLVKAQEEARMANERALGLEQKYQELQELNAKMTSRGLVLTLGDVLFETGQASLMSGAKRALDKLVDFLAENEERKVLIEGHTDNVGSTIYNIDLSLRRAEAVLNVLKEKGIDEDRIVTKGYGEQYPVTGNISASGKQQNRRVEIVILNEGDTIENVTR
ncbi:MAG TPA: DUF4398 domain-containing protein [Campylobacterales bacterium]|nr:DUF4398 domain-containing protein [Campylobacterales bacterium]